MVESEAEQLISGWVCNRIKLGRELAVEGNGGRRTGDGGDGTAGLGVAGVGCCSAERSEEGGGKGGG